MGLSRARRNRRTEYFAHGRQHLVNHGSQRLVNHAARSGASDFRLTANFKRIPTPFRHDLTATGSISPARESLRRQMRSGGLSAGSSRAQRLDPFSLPARFAATDAAADERVRHVELYRERVVVRRSLGGMRMALNMPVSAFAGVALRVVLGEGEAGATASVTLEHKDPSLALPLFASGEAGEAFAEWRAWGNVLGLPLLVAEDDGVLREPFARLGGVRIDDVRPRRRRRSALKRRRPSMPLRRKAGEVTDATAVHRGEREIIARD